VTVMRLDENVTVVRRGWECDGYETGRACDGYKAWVGM
jgi:hypothetical protein